MGMSINEIRKEAADLSVRDRVLLMQILFDDIDKGHLAEDYGPKEERRVCAILEERLSDAAEPVNDFHQWINSLVDRYRAKARDLMLNRSQ